MSDKFRHIFFFQYNCMNFNIKKAVENDIPQIIALLQEFAEYENLREYCEITEEKLFDAMFGEQKIVDGLVCFDREELIAYAIFYPNFSSFRGERGIYLEDIYIKSAYRAKGIGEAMLREIARLGAEKGAVRMDFQVLNWNSPAVKFYKKLGAQINEDENHFKFAGEAFQNLAG